MDKHLDNALHKLDYPFVLQRISRYASTVFGAQAVAGLTPCGSASEAREELARVTELKTLLESEEGIPFEGAKPVRAILHRSKVQGAVLQPIDLFAVSSTLRCSREVRSLALKRKQLFPVLWELCEHLPVDKVLEFNIDRAVDETGAVKDSASKELKELRRAIADSYDSLKRRLGSILREATEQGFAQEEIITTREGRMVIPVRAEYRNRVPGFVHSASSSGATVFVEPADTLDLNNEVRNLQFRETREIERILKELTAQVSGIADALIEGEDRLGYLDSLQARARYSIEILGNEPRLGDTGPLRLIRARHPVLIHHHGLNSTIPLDLELDQECRTLVISGPNAGGKSVAMQSVGLLVLMAQSGMHIPADAGSTIPFFPHVFVDIGDDQSIESDLSTFSSHLVHLREITAAAGEGSLVLIDEIGSGTDPVEGGAIAAAVLETLTHSGAFTIATTHQGALKVFAHETEGMENGAMEFDQSTLTPTYRFRPGVPGSSYAFELATRHGLPGRLLVRARELLGGSQARMESLVLELEGEAQRYKARSEELREKQAAVEEKARTVESRLSQLTAEVRETKRRALEEAGRIVDGAHALIERTVREIREREADRSTVKDAREQVEQLRTTVAEEQRQLSPAVEEAPASRNLAVGSRVRIAGSSAVGEVESLSPDGMTAMVALGSVRMKTRVSDLSVTAERVRPSALPEVVTASRTAPVQQELDLRGMTGDEALPLVDKFIDDAILSGLSRLTIIHGKGTGALRKKVAEFLARHPRVLSAGLAEWNEGGTGATVVQLRES